MPRIAFLAAALTAAIAAAAAPARAQQPRELSRSGSWTAAVLEQGGQKVCYAFARAARGEAARAATLTVTHRPGGRDQVALSPGHAYPREAEAVLTVGSQEFRSYAEQGANAFFQGGAQLVAAFRGGREAVARSPAASGRGTVTDTFPLSGFSAAYDAISRECPAAAAPRASR